MKKLCAKIMIGILIVAMLFSLCACGKDAGNSAEDTEPSRATPGKIESIQSEIEAIASENADADIGQYVTPDASCFTCEQVDGGVAITGYTGEAHAITVPEVLAGEPVVEIAPNAFTGSEVVGVKLPDTLIKIDENGFFYCTTLVEISFGKNTVEIGSQAFEGCIALSAVRLNNGLETLEERAFGYCTSLHQIDLPGSLKVLGSAVFALSGIESITIPGNVETIDTQAFSTCNNLKTVNIEDGVKTIEKKAFEACNSLTSVRIPASVIDIGNRAFSQSENVTINAPTGSVAEEYAKENNIAFNAE